MKPQRPSDPKSDDALDREIAGLLSVQPPADFVNKVRSRIAREPAPKPWLFRPWTVALATTAVAAVMVMIVFWPAETRPTEVPARTAEAVKDPAPVTPPTAARPIANDVSVPFTVGTQKPTKPAKQQAANLELLIPATESRAIRRLLDGQFGPVPPNFSDISGTQEGSRELVVPQIAIEPVEIPKPITIDPIGMTPAITEEGV
jgi:hypothetical protein